MWCMAACPPQSMLLLQAWYRTGNLGGCALEAGRLTSLSACAVESPERKDSEAPVTILQLVKVPSVCVLLIASLLAAASLTFLDPLLGEHLRMP